MDGYYGDDVYFNSPLDYLPNLEDHGLLEALRRNHLIFTTGEHDPCKEANLKMSRLLHEKGIPHHLEMLHGAFGHDWPWWQDLLRKHVG